MYNGNAQQNPSCGASCHKESSHISPVLDYDFLSRCKFSTPTVNRLYAQNPVFEIVREESVKVYLHMHNGKCSAKPSMRRFLFHYGIFHLSPVLANDV